MEGHLDIFSIDILLLLEDSDKLRTYPLGIDLILIGSTGNNISPVVKKTDIAFRIIFTLDFHCLLKLYKNISLTIRTRVNHQYHKHLSGKTDCDFNEILTSDVAFVADAWATALFAAVWLVTSPLLRTKQFFGNKKN